eukprot:4427731-Amphidinium_carterae.1
MPVELACSHECSIESVESCLYPVMVPTRNNVEHERLNANGYVALHMLFELHRGAPSHYCRQWD